MTAERAREILEENTRHEVTEACNGCGAFRDHLGRTHHKDDCEVAAALRFFEGLQAELAKEKAEHEDLWRTASQSELDHHGIRSQMKQNITTLEAELSRLRAAAEEVIRKYPPLGDAAWFKIPSGLCAGHTILTAALSPAPAEVEEATEGYIDECPACRSWLPGFGDEVMDGALVTCRSCGVEVEACANTDGTVTLLARTADEEEDDTAALAPTKEGSQP